MKSKLSGLSIAALILIIISLIVSAISLPFMIISGGILSAFPVVGEFFVVLWVVLAVGIIFSVFSLILLIQRHLKRAGIFAIIASFLPPLNVLLLLAGIFLLLSKEK